MSSLIPIFYTFLLIVHCNTQCISRLIMDHLIISGLITSPSLNILLKKCSELSESSIETLIIETRCSVVRDHLRWRVKEDQKAHEVDERSLRTHFTIFTDKICLLIWLLFLFLLSLLLVSYIGINS